MSFTIEAVLDTKEPNVIEFLGPPSTVIQHEITGTLRLSVQKAIQLKQLLVAFVGAAFITYSTTMVTMKSEAVTISRSEFNVISATTPYLPGEYSFPFRITLPGDLASSAAGSKLKSGAVVWGYELVTLAVPTGLFARRKVQRQPLYLKRVHVPPSDTSNVRYGARRPGNFECSIYAPKFISCQETTVRLSIYLHPFHQTYGVKEILAHIIQIEKVTFNAKKITDSVRRMQTTSPSMDILRSDSESEVQVDTDTARVLSKQVTVQNPDQEEFTTAWGREVAIELDLELKTSELLPSESLDWIKISHGIRFTIVFADSTIRPLVVMAPFQIGNILEELWSFQPAPEGVTPPDYGTEDDHSTLLDSNTTRMSMSTRQQLYREVYPEREPIVPDLADDLPPDYNYEGERLIAATAPFPDKLTL
ncbi:hypothetical protein BX616_002415 [Lobosporangium transversale]|nr:hypothetical protein BX616_002415 [Lobosporangium transversale]